VKAALGMTGAMQGRHRPCLRLLRDFRPRPDGCVPDSDLISYGHPDDGTTRDFWSRERFVDGRMGDWWKAFVPTLTEFNAGAFVSNGNHESACRPRIDRRDSNSCRMDPSPSPRSTRSVDLHERLRSSWRPFPPAADRRPKAFIY